MKLSVLELDVLKIKFYNEFYEKNKEMYEKSPNEFFFKQSAYCEREIRKYLADSSNKGRK